MQCSEVPLLIGGDIMVCSGVNVIWGVLLFG